MVKENSIQSEKFSLHARLKSLNTTEYYDLVSSFLLKKPELNQLVWNGSKKKRNPLQKLQKMKMSSP